MNKENSTGMKETKKVRDGKTAGAAMLSVRVIGQGKGGGCCLGAGLLVEVSVADAEGSL